MIVIILGIDYHNIEIYLDLTGIQTKIEIESIKNCQAVMAIKIVIYFRSK